MKKKKKNPVQVVVIILFVIYIGIYALFKGGYYDYREYNKMILTEKSMKKFENDVKEGKDITASDYLETKYKDYSNNVSKLGLKTGEYTEKLVTKGLGGFIKVLSKLFTN